MSLNKLIAFLLIAFTFKGFSQSDSIPSYQLGLKTGYGYIISHRPVIEYITEQHNSKIEFFIEKNTFGNKNWHQWHGFPKLGLAFSYFDFNNDRHIGRGYSFSPYLNFKIVEKGIFQLRLKPAIGVGYIGKPFDIEDNFKNVAIGSNVNIFFSVSADVEIEITQNSVLHLGTSFSHFSNTGFKKPNLGINIPTAEVGFSRKLGKKNSINSTKNSSFTREKAQWIVYSGIGANEINPPDGRKYIATGVSIANVKRLNHKSSIGGGVDFYYNPAQIDKLKGLKDEVDPGYDNLQFGLSFYHLLHFDRFQNFVQLGYYLKSQDSELGNFYQIVGGRYEINERWSAIVAFKTHFAKAEYILFGGAIKLGKNEN